MSVCQAELCPDPDTCFIVHLLISALDEWAGQWDVQQVSKLE